MGMLEQIPICYPLFSEWQHNSKVVRHTLVNRSDIDRIIITYSSPIEFECENQKKNNMKNTMGKNSLFIPLSVSIIMNVET